MRLILLPILFLSTVSVFAAEIKVPLVGLGWQIAFEAPPLKRAESKYPEGAVQFRANSGRFNVSLFVEPPPPGAKEATAAACRDFYWPQAKRNPAIVTDSIKQTTHKNCEAVTYRSQGNLKGTPYVQDSVNCFFVHQGKWVDVHASIIEPTADDTRLLSEFPTHLTYGPVQPSKDKVEKFTLEKIGTVSFMPPAGWFTGNLLTNDIDPEYTTFTLSFCSPTDPNSNCLLTFLPAPKVPQNMEEVHQSIETSTKPLLASTVEGKVVFRDLKLKQGIGSVAFFTDASLVGKPSSRGESKVFASGMVVLKPKVLAAVSLFTDDAKGPDAGALVQAVETLVLE